VEGTLKGEGLELILSDYACLDFFSFGFLAGFLEPSLGFWLFGPWNFLVPCALFLVSFTKCFLGGE